MSHYREDIYASWFHFVSNEKVNHISGACHGFNLFHNLDPVLMKLLKLKHSHLYMTVKVNLYKSDQCTASWTLSICYRLVNFSFIISTHVDEWLTLKWKVWYIAMCVLIHVCFHYSVSQHLNVSAYCHISPFNIYIYT